MKKVPLEQLKWVESNRPSPYPQLVHNCKIHIPLLLNGTTILNGADRASFYRRAGIKEVYAIQIPVEAVEDLRASGSWDFSNKYIRDFIRSNAWAAKMTKRKKLSHTWCSWASPKEREYRILPNVEDIADRVRAVFGSRPIDFGCGSGADAAFLRRIGLNPILWEPYYGKNSYRANLKDSVEITIQFLEEFTQGTSIVTSYVLSSCPFPEDRIHILRIVAAITHICKIKYYGSTLKKSHALDSAIGKVPKTRAAASLLAEWEGGAVLTGIPNGNFKVQKVHRQNELYSLLSQFWTVVDIIAGKDSWYFRCADPRPIKREDLRQSLLFEFDLPHEGGSLDCAKLAIQCILNQRSELFLPT